MRYSTVFKFLAFLLCAATLAGAVASAGGILMLTESGAWSQGYDTAYRNHLEGEASNYAYNVVMDYATEHLGGADPRVADEMRYHKGWAVTDSLSRIDTLNYILKDDNGEVLATYDPLESYEIGWEFEIPMSAPYGKIIATMTQEEYQALMPQPEQVASAVSGTQVFVAPIASTSVFHIITCYTDGHHTEYKTGGSLGFVNTDANGDVVFSPNSQEMNAFPEGDGWYINYIMCADAAGNIVYEASSEEGLLLWMRQDGNQIEYGLPGGAVTQTAPTGVTYEEGEFTAYDAIPTQGITVSGLTVSYESADGETAGSEGVASPTLIGTIFHDHLGNAEFHSSEPMSMDVPGHADITDITFLDGQDSVIYEASCSGGVGELYNDENGYLVFRARLPFVADEVPQETAAAEGATPISFPVLAKANENLNVYFAPATTDVTGTMIQQGQEFELLGQKDQDGFLWGRVQEGWVKMDQIIILQPQAVTPTEETVPAPVEADELLATAGAKVNIYSYPIADTPVGTLEKGTTVVLLRTDSIGGENWALIDEGWILLEDMLIHEPLAVAAEAEAVPAETPETLPEETEATEITFTMEPITEEDSENFVNLDEVTDPDAPVQAVPAETDSEIVLATEPVVTLPEGYEDAYVWQYYDETTRQHMVALYEQEVSPVYVVTVQVPYSVEGRELEWLLVQLADALKDYLLPGLGLCLAGLVLSVIYLCCTAARKRGSEVVRAGGLNRIPLDLYLGMDTTVIIGLVALIIVGLPRLTRQGPDLGLIFLTVLSFVISVLVVAFFFAFVAQIKTPGGYWWRNSICGRCILLLVQCGHHLNKLGSSFWKNGRPAAGSFVKGVGRGCRKLWQGTQTMALWMLDTGKTVLLWTWELVCRVWKWGTKKLVRLFGLLPLTWQFLSTAFILVFILYIALRSYKIGWILVAFGLFFAVILYAASAFGILLESASRMSRGDLDTKVDRKMLIGSFQVFAERLNDLAGVAVVAAQKQLKSERMKTELITNVSHDIKTPLTSIINYVDLLQKPHTEQEQEQYLEVLDRQSQRLKKLIDDLMEMSKASTGNMSVDIETVDAGEAVNQALGEFADKLERAQLTPVFRKPEEQVFMLADGKLVWRVMSNLLGNVVKYALPGTRIYLDLLEMDGKVIISMKNISREELNVHADELMERFVRGDASRNTEGSGLGLNIAQSLMELQKGQLQILVDGDLFKVTLIFPGA